MMKQITHTHTYRVRTRGLVKSYTLQYEMPFIVYLKPQVNAAAIDSDDLYDNKRRRRRRRIIAKKGTVIKLYLH